MIDRRELLERAREKSLTLGMIEKVRGLEEIFPDELPEILRGYWERELGRLINPVPELGNVILELKNNLKDIVKPTGK